MRPLVLAALLAGSYIAGFLTKTGFDLAYYPKKLEGKFQQGLIIGEDSSRPMIAYPSKATDGSNREYLEIYPQNSFVPTKLLKVGESYRREENIFGNPFFTSSDFGIASN